MLLSNRAAAHTVSLCYFILYKDSKASILFSLCVSVSLCTRVCVSYAAVVVDVDVVQPAQVLVGLQEAGQLLVLSDRLRQQLPPLSLLHVPAEQEVSEVLQQEVTKRK